MKMMIHYRTQYILAKLSCRPTPGSPRSPLPRSSRSSRSPRMARNNGRLVFALVDALLQQIPRDPTLPPIQKQGPRDNRINVLEYTVAEMNTYLSVRHLFGPEIARTDRAQAKRAWLLVNRPLEFCIGIQPLGVVGGHNANRGY